MTSNSLNACLWLWMLPRRAPKGWLCDQQADILDGTRTVDQVLAASRQFWSNVEIETACRIGRIS